MVSIPRIVPPTYRQIGEVSAEVMHHPKMQAVADRIATEAQRIARAEGHPDLADAVTVTGVRPKGRGQIQVVIDHEGAEAAEYGDTNTEKARILGRAAGLGASIWPGQS